jgi:hypothetical protein
MENIHSNIQGDNMETQKQYDDEMIIGLFNNFIEEGGEPKVTSFKKHLDQIINVKIKPLCGRSAKTGLVEDWRSEVKARFSGRGAKWVKVTTEEVALTLEGFDDVGDYAEWIQAVGFAWIRFAGPRVVNGVKTASFEVRTGGSTIDHPKQLHYIALHDLDDKVTPLAATPHAMKLEEVATTPVVEELEVEEEVIELSGYELDPNDDGGSAWAKDGDEDMMGDLEELMAMEDDEL